MESDDSDFYGDESTKAGLENRVSDFDAEDWLQRSSIYPARPVPRNTLLSNSSHLHNPYAGVAYAWQLTETVDDFLERLPPATTDASPEVPWIFICNPYIPRTAKYESESQMSKGNEDEAPTEEGSRVSLTAEGGLERLALLKDFIDKIKRTNKSEPTIRRETAQQARQAINDILNLAHAAKVRAGKWMLFCTPQEVDEVWGIVAKATAENELGIAAKVAPRPERHDPRQDRLVCIYTTDFRDRADVGRVLQRLRELKLVEARGRPIYYKPDAFTYIGISSGNVWGIRASIYSSVDIFGK